jgi:hypothetical protein
MALSIQLPLQASQYISTNNSFNAAFSAGYYTFAAVANQKQIVIPLEINSVYLIERIFIAGNIPAEDYLSSIDYNLGADNIPLLRLNRLKDNSQCHTRPIPVVQYSINREAPIIIYSDKKGDQLLMTVSGVMVQTAKTLGIDPITLSIGLSIYQINEKFFNQGMKTSMSSEFGLSKKYSS